MLMNERIINNQNQDIMAKSQQQLRRKVKRLNLLAKIIAAPIVGIIYLAMPLAYLYGMGKCLFHLVTGRI